MVVRDEQQRIESVVLFLWPSTRLGFKRVWGCADFRDIIFLVAAAAEARLEKVEDFLAQGYRAASIHIGSVRR